MVRLETAMYDNATTTITVVNTIMAEEPSLRRPSDFFVSDTEVTFAFSFERPK